MSSVQVKNIPDDVHDQLRDRAATEGTTISQYVLELIRRDLARPTRAAWLAAVAAAPRPTVDFQAIERAREELRAERDDR